MDFRSRSFGKHAGGVVVVLAVLIAVDLILAVLTSNAESFGSTLPGFSSVGASVSFLSLGVWVLTYIVAPALIFTLGYRYGISQEDLTPDE